MLDKEYVLLYIFYLPFSESAISIPSSTYKNATHKES